MDDSADAVAHLTTIRQNLAELVLPLELPDAAAARRAAADAAAQLDDYILPRYRNLDAPLLAVVGGSTGAGKSTLVNALAGHPVTRTGAVRPTTRQPVLLHAPGDVGWFANQRVLPTFRRFSVQTADGAQLAGPDDGALLAGPDDGDFEPGPGDVDPQGAARNATAATSGTLQLVSEPSMPRGLALLDAPDVDSVSDNNRRLAGQLLAAADLWVFVTTANRYADAVPWELLLAAAARNVTVAVVLDRVPDGVEEEVSADLRSLLARHQLGQAQLFVVAETSLNGAGMLPPAAVEPLRAWLTGLAADAVARSAVARRTLAGAVQALAGQLEILSRAAAAQQQAADQLAADAASAYADAVRRAMAATSDGALLRGEVLARWQDFVGTGNVVRAIESGVGQLRDRVGAFFRGDPPPVVAVETALESGLHAVLVAEADAAAEGADSRWRSSPAGRQLLAGEDLSRASPGFPEAAAGEIREWQAGILNLIQSEGAAKRSRARWLSFGVNGLGVALMVVVFSFSAGLSGAEVGIAGGTAVIGQKLLEAVFGEDAVRRLAATARADLQLRCSALMRSEAERFTLLLAQLGIGEASTSAGRLLQDVHALRHLAEQA
ncbi:MAG: transporter [Micrococcaceae bacterium]|nr:transporter [Micrococcaceae bacterium]